MIGLWLNAKLLAPEEDEDDDPSPGTLGESSGEGSAVENGSIKKILLLMKHFEMEFQDKTYAYRMDPYWSN